MQSNPTSLRSTLIISSHLQLGLTSYDFPSGFAHQEPCMYLPSHPCYMPCPSHVPWSGTLIIFNEEYKSYSSSLCTLLQPPVTSSLFCRIIFLCSLFQNTLSLCSSLNVRHYVTPIKYNWQNYSSVHFNIQFFIQKTGRDKIPDSLLAGIPQI